MSRLQARFKALAAKKEKALIAFITAGDPSFKKNEELIPCLEREGVDVVELGVPFSDPLADGPVIQASSERSLKKGTTLKKILDLAKRIRQKSQLPLVLMTYMNPIFSYGLERFAKDAKEAGVDGVILPEVPLEESKAISAILKKQKLDLIYMVAPTSTAIRKKKIARASKGFIYYVSMTGVTGSKSSAFGSVAGDVQGLKKLSKLPVCVGFGISNPDQARAMSQVSDGVIVGSALVKALNDHQALSAQAFTQKFVRPFVQAVKGPKGSR